MSENLPESLQEIIDDFAALAEPDKLQLLLEFSNELPGLPERYADHPELLEPVPECQSSIFLVTEVGDGEQASTEAPAGEDAEVRLFFSAPPEAPTTRGFAGILHEGLNGLTAKEILEVPSDLALKLSLNDSVSPLRLRGMSGMLARIQRQVKEKALG